MNPITISRLGLAIVLTHLAFPLLASDEEVQVGRYSSVRPTPTEEQGDIFQTITTVEFPDSIETVGDAINHVLDDQGYEVATNEKTGQQMKTLLDLRLPKSHRHLGPMTLKTVLETLAGPVWFLVQDPVHRLVSFEICDQSAYEEISE